MSQDGEMPLSAYLDNNATTKLAPEVVIAITSSLEIHYGNPSSRHKPGLEAAQIVQSARERVSFLLECYPEEIIFTSCGTESNNLALRGVTELLPVNKKHIVTTQVEHPSVKKVLAYLSQRGFSITEIKVDREGMVDLEEMTRAIGDNTGLVSIMYANNETGVVFPIEDIGKIVKQRGAIFHVDAVQAIGKIPIQLRESSIDLMSLSGHKFHCPKGIGALYVKTGIRIQPQILGSHQEQGLRAGTESVSNVIALGVAANLARQHMADNRRILAQRNRLENWILENIPCTRLNGHKHNRLSNTSNISFRNLEGMTILLALSQAGIYVSTGAACSSGSTKPSDILLAMKVPQDSIIGSIRFSLSRYTTESEIDYTIEQLPKIIQHLRKIC